MCNVSSTAAPTWSECPPLTRATNSNSRNWRKTRTSKRYSSKVMRAPVQPPGWTQTTSACPPCSSWTWATSFLDSTRWSGSSVSAKTNSTLCTRMKTVSSATSGSFWRTTNWLAHSNSRTYVHYFNSSQSINYLNSISLFRLNASRKLCWTNCRTYFLTCKTKWRTSCMPAKWWSCCSTI